MIEKIIERIIGIYAQIIRFNICQFIPIYHITLLFLIVPCVNNRVTRIQRSK